MKRAAIATLGCKVNQVETNSITQQLQNIGYEIVDFSENAELYIINTCTVTNRSDYKSRNLIRHALKTKLSYPTVKIIVTGCYAQKEKDEIEKLGDINLVVDNQNKIDIGLWLDNTEYKFEDVNQSDKMLWTNVDGMHEKTRAFIKIQDGCDFYCSYCAVPYGRGKPRSLPLKYVIEQAEILVNNGYKEIVLAGVNLGLYNDEATGEKLSDVVSTLAKIDKSVLLRLSSIEPDLWEPSLFDCISKYNNVCPHFHIPVQSASDRTLVRMKRHYKTQLVENLTKQLLRLRPDCAIGYDIVCGFPGETDVDCQETVDFIIEQDLTYLHVFGYSKRKSTQASEMPDQIPAELIKERVRALIKTGEDKKQSYIQKLVDHKLVLKGVIEKAENGIASSLSDHYTRIYKTHKSPEINVLMNGKANKKYKDGILII